MTNRNTPFLSRENLEEGKYNVCKKIASRLQNIIKINKDFSILDIGCGGGELLDILSNKTENLVGVEPFPVYNHIKNKKIKIINAPAESLPFDDNMFDLVTLTSTLEHVSDVKSAIKEAIRVSSMYVYLICPNYFFPYESHFKVIYFPKLPKTLGRLYLRLRGFSREEVSFLDHINYTTKLQLYSILKDEPDLTVVDLQLSKNYKINYFFNRIFDLFFNTKFEFLIIKNQKSAQA